MHKIKEIICNNYKIKVKDILPLSGGWMNEKFLVLDENDKKYVFKIFSAKKIEKMSKGEFGINYLDNQTTNNLLIENYMHSKSLNCPEIIKSISNNLMIDYGDNRAVLMSFINGRNISRNDISNEQLFNLGYECGHMHLLFKNVDSDIYSGRYLKLPSISELMQAYEQKNSSKTKELLPEYKELLNKQGEIIKIIKNTHIIDEIPISVTHGDFADDNILFDGNIPYIVDFELVRQNSHLQDVGRILMSYCLENSSLNIDKIQIFLDGYNRINNLTEREVLLSFITVWINEVDMWIKENYFDKEITPKAKRFQDELIYITYNFDNLITIYQSKEENVFDNYKQSEVVTKPTLSKVLRKNKYYGRIYK